MGLRSTIVDNAFDAFPDRGKELATERLVPHLMRFAVRTPPVHAPATAEAAA